MVFVLAAFSGSSPEPWDAIKIERSIIAKLHSAGYYCSAALMQAQRLHSHIDLLQVAQLSSMHECDETTGQLPL